MFPQSIVKADGKVVRWKEWVRKLIFNNLLNDFTINCDIEGRIIIKKS